MESGLYGAKIAPKMNIVIIVYYVLFFILILFCCFLDLYISVSFSGIFSVVYFIKVYQLPNILSIFWTFNVVLVQNRSQFPSSILSSPSIKRIYMHYTFITNFHFIHFFSCLFCHWIAFFHDPWLSRFSEMHAFPGKMK